MAKAKIKDIKLYKQAMAIVYSQYKKPSAYRSGALVKKYKLLYREKYGDDNAYEEDAVAKKNRPLARWFIDNNLKTSHHYIYNGGKTSKKNL